MAQARKSWAGTSLEERRAGRRAQLLEAAIALVSSAGASALTVRATCRESGLTERYFYESFADREALLIALYDQVAHGALQALGTAAAEVEKAAGGDLSGPTDAQAEAMTATIVHAFTSHVLDDPRRARILLTESFADPTLTARGLASIPSFAEVTATAFLARWPQTVDATSARLNATATIGALVHLYLAWLRGELGIDRERLEQQAVALIMALGPATPGSAGDRTGRRAALPGR